MVWVSDLTYIKTAEGWLYLAVVMDLYSRKIVGWSLARTMAVETVIEAMLMAIGRRNPVPGLIHHSDRGSQYACDRYRDLLAKHGILSSMSGSGNRLDNAVAERFFRTLKNECLANWHDMTADQVKSDISTTLRCSTTLRGCIPMPAIGVQMTMRDWGLTLSECPFFLDHYSYPFSGQQASWPCH